MHKPLVLVFPFPLLAHYMRCLALAEMLADEYEFRFGGHSVYGKLVEDAHFNSFPCNGFDPAQVMECSRHFDFSWLNDADIARVFEGQVDAIEKYSPDLVLGDVAPTLKMATEKCHVPYIALTNAYITRYYACTRQLPLVHPARKHLEKLPGPLASKIIRVAEQISFKAVHRPFKRLRSKFGLHRVGDYLEELEGDLNLVCDEIEIFPLRSLPKNYKVIGPLLPRGIGSDATLLHFLNAEKPTIAVSLGSSGDWGKLAVLGSEEFAHFNIVTAGDLEGIIRGKHVTSRKFLDLDQLFSISNVLICHGGNGTIYHGLKHGLYMLCLTSHFEQEWNVQRLEALGYGRHLNLCLDNLLFEIQQAMDKKYCPVKLLERVGQKEQLVKAFSAISPRSAIEIN